MLLPGDEVQQVARGWPTVLGGTTLQYLVMPTLAYLMGRLFQLEGPELVGVVMVGCVPGAMASNVLTLTAGGNTSYSEPHWHKSGPFSGRRTSLSQSEFALQWNLSHQDCATNRLTGYNPSTVGSENCVTSYCHRQTSRGADGNNPLPSAGGKTLSVIKEGGYSFHDDPEGAVVTYRGRKLGKIVTMYEASGRHCFRLGCDTRRNPRTYRGRVKAAEALKIIDGLARQAEKEGWDLDELIVRAWDDKPRSVAQG